MRVLLVHNHYRIPGGEDTVVQAEKSMLEEHGHTVSLLESNNTDISGVLGELRAGIDTVYSRAGKRRVAAEIDRFRPDVMHVHNFILLFSPAVYFAAREKGVPVIQTLHNYRLACPKAVFFRDGHVCEDCLGRMPIPGIRHACYRESRTATAAIVAMLMVHRALGTWTDKVDAYIALTEFARSKLVAGGIPSEKLTVKPNFVHPSPAVGNGDGGFALFVGRLSEEKGVSTLLAAWKHLAKEIPLRIIGDGPLAGIVRSAMQESKGIDWLGQVKRKQVTELMQHASLLIFPSICYEGFPMSFVEALAVGLPVVASNLGSMSSLIRHEETGLHFRAGDADDLVAQVRWARSHPEALQQMRRAAREEYEAKYTADRNHDMLLNIYQTAIQRARA
ncbi:MAG TPA: glycosyltransferase family 4 protein [Verrucomicrobiae bacterium]|nr:glycosyltransferase family 4 protein [Verrucomicrobiae bacterium]